MLTLVSLVRLMRGRSLAKSPTLLGGSGVFCRRAQHLSARSIASTKTEHIRWALSAGRRCCDAIIGRRACVYAQFPKVPVTESEAVDKGFCMLNVFTIADHSDIEL
jgi:hypothetical protein